ncbi:hypothetical protein EV215_1679 [Hypnocyclicus thermotrophus]|uniref:SIMPL domain-containing protein n=1 Tax=Hypnocyclicus thermotrophus TaxID=1627895 RepID=A0AA46DXQ5_9FUSO|nr:SIMPL domain-containing protein [Hypnocyclicus thermotrophus]TDT68612.1 hypothetical protein EV215_1679 [Hypnocyclicus thermotrophus]
MKKILMFIIIISNVIFAGTIKVTGIGKINTKPNIANISLGVMTENEDVSKAIKENTGKVSKIISKLLELGIKEKNINTSNYSLYYDKEDYNDKDSKKIYKVNNSLNIEIENIERIGEIIDLLVKNGVNNIWNISFGVKNREKFEEKAKIIALKNAEEKAKKILESQDLKLGKIKNISENIDPNIPRYSYEMNRSAVAANNYTIISSVFVEYEISY